MEEFIQELDSFIKWYNEQRIKMRLGGMSAIVNINLIHWPSKSDPLALA